MPRPKEFTVRLTAAARMISRARVLLALDESQGDAPDRRVVAERVGTSESTVYLVAKAFATQGGGVEEVIGRKKRATPPVEPKVTGDVEARLIALACSQPPPGRPRWTLRLQLLADARAGTPARPGQVAREDSEYVRHGTYSIFVWSEPLRDWRRAYTESTRTRVD